ncbi:Lectin-domain containing receptor kinase A4.2 [Hordeum vulgare]|nr:Lectin-domain containing receptor kinase A4.2 [Hordeum vulgare]
MAAAVSFSYQTGVHYLFMLLCCPSSIWSLATSSISFTSNFSHPDYYDAWFRMIQLTPSIGNSIAPTSPPPSPSPNQALLQIGDTTYRVNTTIDLRQFLPNLVAIGFSGATGMAVELHQIVSWSFESTLDPPRESPGSRPPTPKTLLPVEIITGPVIGVIAIVCIFVGVRRWQLFARKKRYKALARGLATNEFAEENKLGQGGFACVYKGQLASTSRPAAIKRFKQTSSGKGRKAFEDELKMASRPRHRNRPCRIDRLVLRWPEEPG